MGEDRCVVCLWDRRLASTIEFRPPEGAACFYHAVRILEDIGPVRSISWYLLKKMGQDLRGFLNWRHHMASEAPYSPHRV